MHARCPAAELTKGTLSLNRCDVRCRIAGFLRDAEGSPCVDGYDRCTIWRTEREKEWANKKTGKASKFQTAEGAWA